MWDAPTAPAAPALQAPNPQTLRAGPFFNISHLSTCRTAAPLGLPSACMHCPSACQRSACILRGHHIRALPPSLIANLHADTTLRQYIRQGLVCVASGRLAAVLRPPGLIVLPASTPHHCGPWPLASSFSGSSTAPRTRGVLGTQGRSSALHSAPHTCATPPPPMGALLLDGSHLVGRWSAQQHGPSRRGMAVAANLARPHPAPRTSGHAGVGPTAGTTAAAQPLRPAGQPGVGRQASGRDPRSRRACTYRRPAARTTQCNPNPAATSLA